MNWLRERQRQRLKQREKDKESDRETERETERERQRERERMEGDNNERKKEKQNIWNIFSHNMPKWLQERQWQVQEKRQRTLRTRGTSQVMMACATIKARPGLFLYLSSLSISWKPMQRRDATKEVWASLEFLRPRNPVSPEMLKWHFAATQHLMSVNDHWRVSKYISD